MKKFKQFLVENSSVKPGSLERPTPPPPQRMTFNPDDVIPESDYTESPWDVATSRLRKEEELMTTPDSEKTKSGGFTPAQSWPQNSPRGPYKKTSPMADIIAKQRQRENPTQNMARGVGETLINTLDSIGYMAAAKLKSPKLSGAINGAINDTQDFISGKLLDNNPTYELGKLPKSEEQSEPQPETESKEDEKSKRDRIAAEKYDKQNP